MYRKFPEAELPKIIPLYTSHRKRLFYNHFFKSKQKIHDFEQTELSKYFRTL